MATLIVIVPFAVGFGIAALVGIRAWRRRDVERRRLASLGVVDAHREKYR